MKPLILISVVSHNFAHFASSEINMILKNFKEIGSSRKGVTVAGHLWTCFLIPTPAL